MAYDDPYKLFRSLNDLTRIDRVVRELELHRRLVDSEAVGVARQIEEQRRLMDSTASEFARTVNESSRLATELGTQVGRDMEIWRQSQRSLLVDVPDLVAQYETVLAPVAREVAANLERNRELLKRARTEVAAAEVGFADAIRNLEASHLATRDALRAVGGWTTALEAKAAAGVTMLSRLELVSFRTIVPSMGFVADSFERAVGDLTSFAEFSQTFAAEAMNHLGAIINASDSVASEAAIQSLAEFVVARSERLPKKWLTRESLVQLLFAVLFFGLTHLDDMRREERYRKALHETEKQIVAALSNDAAGDEEPATERYVVTKAVRLRSAPTIESEILRVLRPNMAVEVVEKEGQWLKVEYFDYVDGELKEGWVFKRYLLSLD